MSALPASELELPASDGQPSPRDPPDSASAGPALTIRVALGDDTALVRRGLRALLGAEENIEVIALRADVSTLANEVSVSVPDVLVLDVTMPSRSVLAAIARLRERSPATQIVVLSAVREPLFAQRVLAAGAIGYVAKQAAETELSTAVRAAARRVRFVSPSVASDLDGTRRFLTEDRLTAREVEVLRLIALGHTSAEVARTLSLSPRTVETHRARIHKKLGVASRAELVGYALRRRLLRA